ncbi:MAG: TonB-dependent receptor [Prevotella sp.]|jgi:TonB-linked SusC/RagA family outer membrane protein|nr:TonB-dependent receptor [Prevotella sp.]MCH3970145.1 TonB-dependent receptor [Prevotella sp.]
MNYKHKVVLLLVALSVSLGAFSQNLNLRFQNVTVRKAMTELKQRTGYSFVYEGTDLNTKKKVTVNAQSINEAVRQILQGQNATYEIQGKSIIVRHQVSESGSEPIKGGSQQQKKNIIKASGIVVDSKGEPIIGATVMENGTKNGAVTDINGHYSLDVSAGNDLLISYIGYRTKQVRPNTNEKIVLNEDSKALNEVVVVGYGSMKKADLTGAVDNITSDKMERVKSNTIGGVLDGQIPNLHVDLADGKPGREASFNIRGTTSINGGDPLILIDGIVSTSRTLNNISPQDIENISFLKDASSAAIYGARAAYGVILVQTKTGKKGEVRINYNNYFSWNKATRTPDVYQGKDYFNIVENEFNRNIGQTYFTEDQVNYPDEVLANPSLPKSQYTSLGGKNVLLLSEPHNYYKEWLRTYSPSWNHHLSISGGGEKFRSYLSFDYNYEEGNLKFKPDKVKRYNVRLNMDYDLMHNVKIFTKSSLEIRDDHDPYTYISPFASTLYRFLETTNPFLPETVNANGSEVMTDIGWYKNYIENQSDFKQKMITNINTIGTEIKLLDDKLLIHFDGSCTNYNLNQLSWWYRDGPYIHNSYNNLNTILNTWSDWGMNPEEVQRYNSWNNIYNVNGYFTYNNKIGKHSFLITSGYSFEKYIYHSETAAHQDPVRGLSVQSLNTATGDYSNSDNDDKYANRSIFLRLGYNYMDKYLAQVNGMNNISSKFSKGQRGGIFGSFSAGWKISNESFFENLRKYVNNLKIRASYGILGNQSIGSYDHLSLLNYNYSTYSLDGSRYNYLSTPAPISGNFTWEKAKTTDVGMDMGMLNNRLQFTFDCYQRNTENMLIPSVDLPSVYGASVPKTNTGNLRTRGWELAVTWNNRTNSKHPFIYSVSANISDYNSIITKYQNPTKYLGSYYEGEHLGEIWGLTTLGLYQTDEEAKSGPVNKLSAFTSYAAAGYLKFEDKNQDGQISKGAWTLADHGDFSVIGNTTPRYQYGFTVYMSYRGFDLNAVFKGVGKRDFYPNSESIAFWGPYSRKYAILTDYIVKNRWTEDNPNAYFPRPQGYIALGNNTLAIPQTRYLQNGAYCRLKNLNIGYGFDQKISGHHCHFRVYISGSNLFEFTKLSRAFDPEGLSIDPDGNGSYLGNGTSYPVQRTYAFGVELTF